jgi:LAO/AO transport system kinase
MTTRKGLDWTDPERLARAVCDGDRRALSRAITLVESTKDTDVYAAERLCQLVETGRRPRLSRFGVTGPPGAGKSTLVDALGRLWIAAGRRVAVLTVDPSSPVSGGSVLGDRPRMGQLARAGAFIRTSPSSGMLGGLTRGMRQEILLCEAAGFTDVLVETVGIGQSELRVAELVDVVLLLAPPGGGDDLQALKRGILEVAQVIAVTKADGDYKLHAERARMDLTNALGLSARRRIQPEIVLVSAHTGSGITQLSDALRRVAEPALGGVTAAFGRRGDERTMSAAATDLIERFDFRAALVQALLDRPGANQLAEHIADETARGLISIKMAARKFLGVE